jgi:hypothetical protein
MLRVFLIRLGLGLMAAPAGLAASPRSADWMIPRPVTTPSSEGPCGAGRPASHPVRRSRRSRDMGQTARQLDRRAA